MSYEPNFNDPRVQARCLRAIGFLCGVMSETKPHPWSSRYIDKYLGISSNRLSKYLRDLLLTCTDDTYRYNQPSEDRNICKKYILNKEGLNNLRDLLKLNNTSNYPSVLQVVETDHGRELSTGEFNYNEKSSRLWHPLQRYRKEYRNQILADHGYLHDYDISTCAPTLIHQYSQQIPEVLAPEGKRQRIKWQQGPMDLYLTAINRYLSDKTVIRQRIASEMDLPVAAVKEVVNALFAGAVISNNTQSDIYHILDGDLARIEWLKQDAFIQELVSDIKIIWDYIRPVMPLRTRRQKNGKERRCRITSRQKWNLYFQLEMLVMKSVRAYLDKRNIQYFLMHDGWSCNREIDREELAEYVLDQTGFALTFDYDRLNNIQ